MIEPEIIKQIAELSGLGTPALLAYIIYLHTKVSKNGNGNYSKIAHDVYEKVKGNHMSDIERRLNIIEDKVDSINTRLVRTETKLENYVSKN